LSENQPQEIRVGKFRTPSLPHDQRVHRGNDEEALITRTERHQHVRRRIFANADIHPVGALPRQEYLSRITVRVAQRIQVVRVAEIDWIEAADYCAKLHVGASDYVVRVSLGALERLLDPASFVRVHRSAIVNLERIKEIESDGSGDGEVVLADGTRVRMARSRRAAVERVLGRAF